MWRLKGHTGNGSGMWRYLYALALVAYRYFGKKESDMLEVKFSSLQASFVSRF